MIQVQIDLSSVGEQVRERLKNVINPKSELFRPVVTELIPMISERIHIQGKAADGTKIGTYSNGYLKIRTGNYGNADKVTRGKNKGKVKNAGAYTRGTQKGSARPKYNRSSDSAVILSLTSQMENDYNVFPSENGWGIGFNNTHNADKARWNGAALEDGTFRYGKLIYGLTKEELKYAVERTTELIQNELK